MRFALCQLPQSSAPDSHPEFFAALGKPAALQDELRSHKGTADSLIPAVQFRQCLLLGLRRIRADYPRRASAWLLLANVSLPGHASWQSPSGGWWSCSSARGAQLGPAPSLVEAIAGLEQLCVCPSRGQVPSLTSCWCCGGADFPTHVGDPQACPWCRGSHGDTCVSCHTILHHRDQCRWNSGSHHSYSLPAPGSPTLCPDCWWKWVCQMQSNPRWRRRAVALSDDFNIWSLQQPAASLPCVFSAQAAEGQTMAPCRATARWPLPDARASPCHC